MTSPTVEVGVAFATNPGDAPTYTDISAYLDGSRTLSISRGRPDELDRFDPGHATVILENHDRRFDPEHTGGPYAGQVLPMRRVRVRAVHDGVTYDLFHGFVDGWENTWQGPAAGTTVLTATDGFKVLAATTLPSVWEETVRSLNPRVWWRLGESAGVTTATNRASTGAEFDATIEGAPARTAGLISSDTDGAFDFDGSNDTVKARYPAVPAGSWTVVVWVRQSPVTSPDGSAHTVLAQGRNGFSISVRDDDAGVFPGMPQIQWHRSDGTWAGATVTTARVDDGEPHMLTFSWDGTNLRRWLDGAFVATSAPALVDIWQLPTTIGGGDVPPDEVPYDGVIDEPVVFGSVLSDADVAALYAAGSNPWAEEPSGTRAGRVLDAVDWRAADRDIDTGNTTVQAADIAGESALSHLQAVEATENGAFFVDGSGAAVFIQRHAFLTETVRTTSQATFSDATDDLPYADIVLSYDDQRVINEARFTRDGGIEQVAVDTTSQTAYLRHTLNRSGLLHTSDAEVRSAAQWVVAHYKDPATRVTAITLDPADNDDLWVQALSREIGERVTVVRTPPGGGSPITQESIIEGVRHDIGPGMAWRTTFTLSPAETQEYWVLATSALGSTTRLAY